MKQFNHLKIGIDIRNIGKKRTGDEVVFFELVRSLRIINEYEYTNNKIEFYLFTDVTDKNKLEEIKRDLEIKDDERFKIIFLTPSLIFSLLREKRLLNNKFIWNLWTLPRYLKKHPVDVYHTQYITPFFVSKKIKIVTTIHDVSFKAYKQFIRWSDLFFLKILIPRSLKRADKIIAVSKFTKNEIIKYYNVKPEKVEVVYNGSQSTVHSSQYVNEDIIREKYNLPEKFILYMGTLQPRKNIPRLLEAYLKIKDKIPDTKLVIAGNTKAHNVDKKLQAASYPEKLRTGAGKPQADIVFPGFIDEKDKMVLIKMAHLFAFPSLYEGFGIPILEAMSQGIPVVASDIASLSEVGGRAYLKFNPCGLDEMAKKLYTGCTNEDLRKSLVNLGRSRVEFFSWEKTARKMLGIYEKQVRPNF